MSADKTHEPIVSLEGRHVSVCDGGASSVKGCEDSLLWKTRGRVAIPPSLFS